MEMKIDANEIGRMLEESRGTSDERLDAILDRAESFGGLSPDDVAALLTMDSPGHLRRMFAIAGRIKEKIYGERVVMFAPLYISDYCVNKCEYCGYKCDNVFERRRLTMDEVRREAAILEKMGHKRLALEAGEDPVNCPIDYVLDVIKTLYEMKEGSGEIRRVNVNIAATTVENYRKLHEAGIGTYILFQETYHEPTYRRVHKGPKADYQYHLTAFDRAMRAGIDDVGAGVLFGLYDANFEVLGLMLHNEHLDRTYGAGFHTISAPRLCEAPGMDKSAYPDIPTDENFLRIVATIRLAVPYTGMIISTRESPQMRKELIRLGISQISGGSSVEVGGYTLRESYEGGEQFEVADRRSAIDVMRWLMDENLVPSFCTACYRKGRTGDRFMSLAKSGNIKNVCLPNALMTLCEYMEDYGDEAFKEQASALIEKNIVKIENDKIRALTADNIRKIKEGERDLYV